MVSCSGCAKLGVLAGAVEVSAPGESGGVRKKTGMGVVVVHGAGRV